MQLDAFITHTESDLRITSRSQVLCPKYFTTDTASIELQLLTDHP